MSFFGSVRAAYASQRHVLSPHFVTFEFASGPLFVWEGAGDIIMEGDVYRGAADLGSISDATFGAGDAAGNIVYTLSGVNEDVIAAAKEEEFEVRGRDVLLRRHFMDVETQALLDDPIVVRQDIMDVLAFSASGPNSYSVKLTCETIWTNRNAAAYAYYSGRDQRVRFAADEGMDFVVQMKNKRVRWPDADAF